MYKRIRELREDNDVTQKEISEYLGIDQSNYSKIELGKQYVKDEILIKLANFYCTSIDYLLRTNKSKNALSSCEFWTKKINLTVLLFCAMLNLYKK